MAKRNRGGQIDSDVDSLDWPYGDRFMVYQPEYRAWYLGKVVEWNNVSKMVRIRYPGWGDDADIWIHYMSDR